ncbi:PTS sugar transporter subunit IIC [Breznakiella homolactica]|uniref:PTS sugar transporter subunit IIC n=1 Tax=Breznakiella homolactica TaxID=2798577 RepID=A0A7T7XLK9_9SPIR|nr:PTS sugar transporter subunit IIC [Breznakiella homolactica]QQO08532.1 PTS sugar transporter subunit IIC [Breznakiella homolactica]
MFFTALLVFVVTAIIKATYGLLAVPLIDRPIFAGFLIGLILGDVTKGIIIGAQLELVFMGVVAIGGGDGGADYLGAAVIATAIGITQNLPVEVVLPVGITLGYAGYLFSPLRYFVGELFIPITDKHLKAGNLRKFDVIAIVGFFLAGAAQYLFVFVAVLFGGDVVTMIMEKTPVFVLEGITLSSGILPGIGLAMIISMLWSSKTAIYFFVGFFLVKYLGVDLVFLFVMALAIGLTELFLKMDLGGKASAAAAVAAPEQSEEEGFLS